MLELAGEYDVPIRLPLAESSTTTMDGIPEPLAASMQEAALRLLAQFRPRSADGFFVTFYAELEILTDPHMRAEIEKHGIELFRFAQLHTCGR